MNKNLETELVKKYLVQFKLNEIIDKNLISSLEIMDFNKGECICRAGEDSPYLFLLIKGEALVKMETYDGKVIHLGFLKPLNTIGEIELINKVKVYGTVEAFTSCRLIAIPRELAKINFLSNIHFHEFLLKKVMNKFLSLSNSHCQLLFRPLKERFAYHLISILGKGNRIIKFHQKKSALFLGVSTRHLRRVIKELEMEGALMRSKRDIIILDKSILKKYINSK